MRSSLFAKCLKDTKLVKALEMLQQVRQVMHVFWARWGFQMSNTLGYILVLCDFCVVALFLQEVGALFFH